MIPNSGYPSQEQASRAMAQADEFVRRTREQSNQQLQAQHYTYTGGMQPGVMSYAAGAGALAYRGGAGYLGAQATMMGMGAAVAQPITRDIMMAGSGARPGLMPQGFFGLMTTAYAPGWMLPHAAQSFHMESGLRREFAQEELGRRWDMFGRRAAVTSADLMTLGISSHIMRRTGVEARLFTEMSTERMLQSRLGMVRGAGEFGAATGFGVNRRFLTEGAGSEAMAELMGGAAGLQSQTGYNRKQLDLLTGQALGALDPTRITAAARGGSGGMRALGQEARQIRDEMARMAKEMNIMEDQIPQFFDSLKGTLRVTGAGLAGFREETRRAGLQGPFSQMQAAQTMLQGQAFGRGLYMDPTSMGKGAFSRALEVAQLRERGVITSDTLMREGGGYGLEAMQRMAMQRLQIQAQAVQSGQFNRELILARANPGAYGAMLSGAGFFETQGAVAGAVAADPFALLRARLDPATRERVTMDADLAAFRGAQQRIPFLPGGRDSAVGIFAKRMNMTIEQAQPWYEEHEVRLGSARRMAGKLGLGGNSRTQDAVGDVMVSMSRRMGLSMEDVNAAAKAALAGGKSLGGTPEEIEDNIIRGRASLAKAQFGTAQNRLFGGVSSSEALSAAGVITSKGYGGFWDGTVSDLFRGKTGVNLAFSAWERSKTQGRLSAEDRSLSGAVSTLFTRGASPVAMQTAIEEARSALGPGASNADIESRVLGRASEWEMDQQGKNYSMTVGGTTVGLGTFTAIRSRLAVVDNEVKLQRQRLELSNEERAFNAAMDVRPGDNGVGRWVDISSESLAVNSREMLAAQVKLAGAGGTGGGTLQEFIGMEQYQNIRKSATRAFGTLQSMGLLSENATRDKFTALLDVEKNPLFKSIENTPAFGPLARAIRGFTSGGGVQDAEAALQAVPEKQLQSLIKKFAEGRTVEEIRAITGSSGAFKEFVGGLGPDRQEFARQLLQMSVVQSDRLVRATPLGSGIGSEMFVNISKWTAGKLPD